MEKNTQERYCIKSISEGYLPAKHLIDVNGKTEEYNSLEQAQGRAEEVAGKKLYQKSLPELLQGLQNKI